MELEKLRKKIDKIDSEILELLNSRAEIASQIGHYKLNHDILIEDSEREDEIIEKLCSSNTGPMSEKDVRIVFMDVIVACRNLQKTIK